VPGSNFMEGNLSALEAALRQAPSLAGSLLSAKTLPEVMQRAVDSALVLGAGPAVILSQEVLDRSLRVAAFAGIPAEQARAFELEAPEGLAREVWAWAARAEDPLPLREEIRRLLGLHSPIVCPLGTPARLIGLWVVDVPEGPGAELLKAALRQFGASVSNALAAVEAQGPALEDAGRDALTGLHDRRFAEQQLGKELARARRYRERLSLMLIDIDRFLDLNERHSYGSGDRVLREMARLLIGFPTATEEAAGLELCFRASDLAARCGPDSFLVLLPATARDGAQNAAERFLDGLRQYPFSAAADSPQTARVTATAAVVTFPEDGDSASGLITLAESLAADAAQAGGDRVVLSPSSRTWS
jgi:diguanylate cyclase (GGDEF)-like protein